MDLRPEGLRKMRRKLPEAWLLQAEATNLPLMDGAFDAVLALDILEHVDDQRLLAEVQRVLRPGGLAIIGLVPAFSSRASSLNTLVEFRGERSAEGISV